MHVNSRRTIESGCGFKSGENRSCLRRIQASIRGAAIFATVFPANQIRSAAIETSFLPRKEEAEGMLRFAGPGQSVGGLWAAAAFATAEM